MIVFSPRPRLLMVTHRVPYPPNRGDRVRTWNILRRLSELFEVHLACLSDEPVHMSTWRVLQKHTARCVIEPVGRLGRVWRGVRSLAAGRSVTEGAFYTPRLQEKINEWAAETRFDAALAVCSSTARYIAELPIERKVLDLVDVDSRKWADYAEASRGPSRWVYTLEAWRLQNAEARMAAAFDVVAVTTEREAELLRRIAPTATVQVVSNGVSLPPQSEVTSSVPTAVFTGVLDYKPNVEGVTWLATRVWPRVLQQIPSAELHIVGRRAVDAVVRLSALEGIKVIGEVPDVLPHLRSAHVAVAPLAIARGIQNKVLEAMAAGRAVIATSAVAGGIRGAEAGKEIAIADTPEQWAAALVSLLGNAAARGQLARAGRQFAVAHHQWNRCIEPLLDALDPIEHSMVFEPIIHTAPLALVA